jgi:hypothetical protein
MYYTRKKTTHFYAHFVLIRFQAQAEARPVLQLFSGTLLSIIDGVPSELNFS